METASDLPVLDRPERAIIVALGQADDLRRQLLELKELTRTAGAQVVATVLQDRDQPHIATYVGKGKLEELKAAVAAQDADLVVVDDELRPAQQRNMADAVEVKVIDRAELILDIFAQRARSAEGKLQVELAQLEYTLPRLTGFGVMMSRIGGTGRGAGPLGVRGPGETKLELDRRRIRHRMTVLRRRLEEVRARRARARRERRRSRLPLVAVVGYTNAGKSTLLNALAATDIATSNRLFETLDPTVRKVDLGQMEALMSDTVGFIERLPHQLVVAFRATLEEVVEADALLHVVDASDPNAGEQIAASRAVLEELEALDRPMVIALNKLDLVTDAERLAGLRAETGGAVAISALRGTNLDALRATLTEALVERLVPLTLHVPYDRLGVLKLPHEHGRVVSTDYQDDKVVAEVEVERDLMPRLHEFIVAES